MLRREKHMHLVRRSIDDVEMAVIDGGVKCKVRRWPHGMSFRVHHEHMEYIREAPLQGPHIVVYRFDLCSTHTIFCISAICTRPLLSLSPKSKRTWYVTAIEQSNLVRFHFQKCHGYRVQIDDKNGRAVYVLRHLLVHYWELSIAGHSLWCHHARVHVDTEHRLCIRFPVVLRGRYIVWALCICFLCIKLHRRSWHGTSRAHQSA